jgi:D-alanyl-D-alanine carboxypeptidase (penicillin-binding protein 5/6)
MTDLYCRNSDVVMHALPLWIYRPTSFHRSLWLANPVQLYWLSSLCLPFSMRRFLLVLLPLVFCPVLLLQPVVFAQTVQPAVVVQKKNKQPATSTPTKRKTTTAAPRPKVATPKKTVAKSTTRKSVNTKKTRRPQATHTKKAGLTAAKKQTKTGKPAAARKQKLKTVKASRTVSPPLPASVTSQGAFPINDISKQISARSVMVMDAGNGEPIFAKMADNPRQPASTIKIVTALIALESLKTSDNVEVSRHAADMPSSKIFLEPSKSYQAEDLINAVLLASANDASVALAEKIAGSEEKFAHLMTLSAKMWGAKNTICRTASGLTAVGQQSTARDLANLFRFAMQNDEFSRRMKEKSIRTSYGKNLRNHNKALWRIDGAIGGKTGYTVAARQTYVGQFTREGKTIIVAIMGSESMWADLGKLVDYGFKKIKTEQIARAGT